MEQIALINKRRTGLQNNQEPVQVPPSPPPPQPPLGQNAQGSIFTYIRFWKKEKQVKREKRPVG